VEEAEVSTTSARRRQARWSFFRETGFVTSEGEKGDGVERSFGEGDDLEADAVVEHAFGRESEEVLRDLVEGGAGGEDEDLKSRALKVAVDPVLFERVEREISGLEDRRLVGVGDPTGQLLLARYTLAKEHRLLPVANLGDDLSDDGGGRRRREVEDDLSSERQRALESGEESKTHPVEVSV
jgi:hypothetical protein